MIDVEHIDEIRGSSILGIVDPEYQEALRKALMMPMKVKTQMLNLRLLD